MASFSRTRFAAFYFAFQAIAISIWWIALWRVPEIRAFFRPAGSPEADLLAFWLPDLALGVPASIAAAVLLFRRDGRGAATAWLAAGGMVYGALYCLAWAWGGDSAWWSVALMVPAAFFSMVSALDVSVEWFPLLRTAKPSRPTWSLTKTVIQIAFFWGFFLFVMPMALRFLERKLGFEAFEWPGQILTAWILLVMCSILGLSSGLTMAKRGLGTPLPLDGPRRLVISGPYAWIRNPMVVAGLGQGLAIGLYLGSWTVIGYVLVGGLIWQFLVRPAEERDLADRLGEEYQAYRRRVPCWLPRGRFSGDR